MAKKKTKTNWDAVNEIIRTFKVRDIDAKKHFRFGKLEFYELAKIRTTRHAKYNINYHFVWIPKTRSKVLQGEIANAIKAIIIRICKEQNWYPLALEIMPDHIHFFMSAPPKFAPSVIMKTIKGCVSRRIRQMFPILRKYRKDGLWADSYYVGVAGHVSQEQVIKYVMEQTKEFSNVKPFSQRIFDKAQKTLSAFF